MRVMSQSPDPFARMHTMTKRQGKTGTIDVKAVLAEDEEFLRALVEFIIAMGNWMMFSLLFRNLRIPMAEGLMVWPPDGLASPAAQR
jgi:hypothetical protein